MKYIPQSIPDIVLIQPKVLGDDRGYFVETFRQETLEKQVGHTVNFVQDNESKSNKGVLRGLHFQLPPYAQSKLVRVIVGEVLDVVVDIRKNSPTFGQVVTTILNDTNKHQLYIPRGFAHGFLVLSDTAIFSYKVDNYYSPEHDRGLAYDDASLNINWQLPKEELILSQKDKKLPSLSDIVAESRAFDIALDLYA